MNDTSINSSFIFIGKAFLFFYCLLLDNTSLPETGSFFLFHLLLFSLFLPLLLFFLDTQLKVSTCRMPSPIFLNSSTMISSMNVTLVLTRSYCRLSPLMQNFLIRHKFIPTFLQIRNTHIGFCFNSTAVFIL